MIGDDLALKAVQLLGEKIVAIDDLHRQFNEHRAGAVVSCDQECFCWQVEGWFNRMEEDNALAKETI